MESGLEPNYARDGQQGGSGSEGLQENAGVVAASEPVQDETFGPGEHDATDDQQEERAAAALLAQAEDLEPEYDFESVEGVHSPGQEDQLVGESRDSVSGLNRQQYHDGSIRSQRGQAEPQVLEQPASGRQTNGGQRQSGATREMNGTAGLGKGSGAPPSFAGWEEAGFTMQTPMRFSGEAPGWSLQGGRASEEARMETLETLVQQLLEQNERLKREVRDHSSRSSCESERDRVGDVQDVGRRKSECRGTAEGRGAGPQGEVRVKSGKGIGSEDGKPPTLRIFQPPWTHFAHAEASSATALPVLGPGDRFLAATRALQDLQLDDVQDAGDGDVVMERPAESPWPVPASTSVSGIPQFSAAQDSRPLVAAVPAAVGSSVESRRADPAVEPSSAAQRDTPSVVTVMINGVPRKGVFNAAGEVVIQSESPKYFALGDQARPEGERENPGSGNPFYGTGVDAVQVGLHNQGRGPPSIPPPPPPPPRCRMVIGVLELRLGRIVGVGLGTLEGRAGPLTPAPPRAPIQAGYQVNASPATPGGTRVPRAPPPASPTAPEVRSVAHSGIQALEEGDAKDFRPGERTFWELPLLAPVGEANPAMRFSDWVHRVTPFFNDLAPRGHEWWQRVLLEAKTEYDKWCKAKPLERSRLVGRPSSVLQSERFVRIEARGVAMLTKALPAALYEQALSVRCVSCTCMLFLTMPDVSAWGFD